MANLSRRKAVQVLLGACSIPLVGTLCSCSPAADDKVVISPGTGHELDVSDFEAKLGCGVSTSCAPATEIGMEILRSGGNAVDAAIAVSYALGVCQPYGSGVGGGGGMLVYDMAKGSGTFIDYYDAAPRSFAVASGASCVPGLVRGMERASQLFGTKDVGALIQPSIDLARNGFTVSEKLATMISNYAQAVQDLPGYRVGSGLVGEGDTLVQELLAEALEILRDGGSAAFYEGELAQEIRAATGFSEDDMTGYAAAVRDAVSGECLGCAVYSAPAPLAGTMLIDMLKMMDMRTAPAASADAQGYLAALAEATAAASAIRARFVADPDFVSVQEDRLLSDDYVRSVLDSQDLGVDVGYESYESESTTAFTVVDGNGLIVSVTNTLGEFFGSGTSVHGFLLNNHMTSFSSLGANAYEPGKRPRSFTAPSVVVSDSFALGIGTPGGRRIPQILVSVLHDMLVGGEDVQTAVDKNRAVFVEGTLYLEKLDDHPDLVNPDDASAYSVIRKGKGDLFGAVQIMGCTRQGKLFGANDDRREGSFEIEEG